MPRSSLHFLASALALACGILALSAKADVAPTRHLDKRFEAADVREGGFVLAPQAFLAFCRTYPSDCAPSGESRVALDADMMGLLREVNARVNATVAPVELRGPDVWQLGLKAGHCAIYAVQKRHDLIEMGLPAAALSLAVVTAPTGDLHLVLVVRSDRGAVVLDNLNPNILPWTATSYEYRRIQSRDNPMFWVSVAGSRPAEPLLASAGPAKRAAAGMQVQPPREDPVGWLRLMERDPLQALPPRVTLAALTGDNIMR